jgi:hypothetical protein
MRKPKAKNMHAGKTLGWAGATPLFDGFQPPKVLWGRSRPSPRNGDRVLSACIQRCNRPEYREEMISDKERRKSRWQY